MNIPRPYPPADIAVAGRMEKEGGQDGKRGGPESGVSVIRNPTLLAAFDCHTVEALELDLRDSR